MSGVFYPQWRDANTSIAYPLGDSTTRRSQDGRMLIPNDWLVDAAIYSPITAGMPYISQLVLSETGVSIEVSDDSGQVLGTGSTDRFSTNPIVIRDADGQPIATLIVGEAASSPLFAFRAGTYRFVPEATEIVASCVFWPSTAGFQGFQVGSERYLGVEMNLVGEQGIQLTTESTVEILASGETVPVQLIRIHAVGDAQYLTRECSDPAQRPNRFVREIVFQYGDFTHVCRPDKLGNIMFLSGSPSTQRSALKVISDEDSITLGLHGSSLR